MLVLLAVTGDIYYEGLVNVIDSQASNVERTHKRKKLKDPHTGAFAIVCIA